MYPQNDMGFAENFLHMMFAVLQNSNVNPILAGDGQIFTPAC